MLVALVLPYAIRFVQCLLVYRSTGNRGQVRARTLPTAYYRPAGAVHAPRRPTFP